MTKALIIDDERPARIAISKLGHWQHYHISPPEMLSGGKEAISAMRELHPGIVFVDMNMPGMDGCKFLQKATQEFPETQYIVISGYDEFSYAQQAIRYGVSDYLLKPIEEEALNAAIEKALLKIDPDFDPAAQDPDATAPVSPNEIVDEIKAYIDSNYCTNIKVTMFEEKYFFSTEYLSKLFRAKYNCTIYEYVLVLRMRRAKELLSNPDNRLQDIAERLGYIDSHYFSKAFRHYYGVSPSQCRGLSAEDMVPAAEKQEEIFLENR